MEANKRKLGFCGENGHDFKNSTVDSYQTVVLSYRIRFLGKTGTDDNRIDNVDASNTSSFLFH
ncbi:protein transport protein SEC23-like [Gossypium australe]|uniref:Protein transport protein SEC23-like n=1 Tax=Gossypium australe TaxID=47621 RepID=A0A5B6VZU5_9ROSI|nr:protein transport protein SEC23-like [Gossypium australe]